MSRDAGAWPSPFETLASLAPQDKAVLSAPCIGVSAAGPCSLRRTANPVTVAPVSRSMLATNDALATARHLARAVALFAGTSTGANLAAAIATGQRRRRQAAVVTVMCDSGLKYPGTRLYDGSRPWFFFDSSRQSAAR